MKWSKSKYILNYLFSLLEWAINLFISLSEWRVSRLSVMQYLCEKKAFISKTLLKHPPGIYFSDEIGQKQLKFFPRTV